jgi:hypothetical protein
MIFEEKGKSRQAGARRLLPELKRFNSMLEASGLDSSLLQARKSTCILIPAKVPPDLFFLFPRIVLFIFRE